MVRKRDDLTQDEFCGVRYAFAGRRRSLHLAQRLGEASSSHAESTPANHPPLPLVSYDAPYPADPLQRGTSLAPPARFCDQVEGKGRWRELGRSQYSSAEIPFLASQSLWGEPDIRRPSGESPEARRLENPPLTDQILFYVRVSFCKVRYHRGWRIDLRPILADLLCITMHSGEFLTFDCKRERPKDSGYFAKKKSARSLHSIGGEERDEHIAIAPLSNSRNMQQLRIMREIGGWTFT